MRKLSRTLAMLVSFQLFWGCNGSATMDSINSISEGVSDTVEISGSIAKTFKTISNFIIPSAVAADGILQVMDASDPSNPVEIYKEELKGVSDYKVILERALVEDKIIKMKFVSNDKVTQRDHYFAVPKATSKLSATLNVENTTRAKVLEKQLVLEQESKDIVSNDDLLNRFDTLVDAKVDDQLNMLGADNKEAILSLLQDKTYATQMIEYLALHRFAVEKNYLEGIDKAVLMILQLGISANLMNDGVLICADDNSSARLLFAGKTAVGLSASGQEEEIIKSFGYLADVGDTASADKVIGILKSDLEGLVAKFGKNLSVLFTVTYGDKAMTQKSCLIKAAVASK